MRTKFFTIPALDPAEAEEELNRFLAKHRVLALDRALLPLSGGGCWSVCVTYQEGARARGRGKVDYKEVLSPEDFAVYAALRELRKEVAVAAGVPAYQIFKNAELAAMITGRMRTLDEVRVIEGIGPSRLEAHGARFLDRLKELQRVREKAEADETDSD